MKISKVLLTASLLLLVSACSEEKCKNIGLGFFTLEEESVAFFPYKNYQTAEYQGVNSRIALTIDALEDEGGGLYVKSCDNGEVRNVGYDYETRYARLKDTTENINILYTQRILFPEGETEYIAENLIDLLTIIITNENNDIYDQYDFITSARDGVTNVDSLNGSTFQFIESYDIADKTFSDIYRFRNNNRIEFVFNKELGLVAFSYGINELYILEELR